MLPTALLDLTFLRLSALRSTHAPNAVHVLRRVSARGMQQVALATPPPPYNYPPPMISSGQTMWDVSAELERRVKALQEAAVAERADLDPPSYTEQDLIFLYEDLLALPKSDQDSQPDPAALERAQAERDLSIVNAVDQRLYSDTLDTSPEELHDSTDPALHPSTLEPSVQPFHRVLARAHDIVSRVEAVRASLDGNTTGQDFVPISVLSMSEYESLIRVCVRARDGNAAERALNIMKRSGVPFPENAVTDVLELYADDGNVKGVEHVLATYLTTIPTDRQRHLHVKSHIKATSPDTIPTSALHVLHSYETQCHPAPMQTYTSLITSLFSTRSSLGKAHAWDLFSHMRYVAHPEPDVPLYTLMIRACASPISSSHSSDPLRALDLWTEMTVDHRLPPSLGAYNAIILACARSGSKTYVNEAFRLAKQMLDSHRDARGASAFRPDRKTFCALLEGAKRLGDLARARWILAEMVNGRNKDESDVDGDVNEEVMMHVFHAYAAYRPPFRRAATLLVNQQADVPPPLQQQKGLFTSDSEMSTTKDEGQTANVAPLEATPTFSHIPPQDRSEVIQEVKSLFSRILDDIGLDPSSGLDMDDTLLSAKKFKNVQLTPRLLNSYLSVYYKHSSLETSRELFWRLFHEHGISRTSRTYIEALQRCANTKRGHEREVSLRFAEEIWAKWQALEDVRQEDGRALSGRVIEKAHIAFIRVLTLSGQLDRAVHQVRLFAERYPPSALCATNHTKSALRSTRTILVGQRPLVRMTSSTEMPDDHVPPLLLFDDLELLHHRLVAAEAGNEIGYIKYLSKAYEWGLRVRRDNTMKARSEDVDQSSVVAR